MATTRRSARNAGSESSSPMAEKSTPNAKAGTKRKQDESPSEKPSKKVQKKLEDVIPGANGAANGAESTSTQDESKDASKVEEREPSSTPQVQDTNGQDEPTKDESDSKEEQKEPVKDESDAKPAASQPEQTISEGGEKLVADAKARDSDVPSNIIEKGIIYFFTRGRVGIDDPESVQDLQRTYFVMRPIPLGAKLGSGPLDDSEKNRLMALPKKVFPKSERDKFMAFVEKGKTSMSQLKEEFFQGSDYETQTLGTRHTPSIAPLGEGIYAITKTGRTSHLVYMLTIPKELGQVQSDVGLCEKGSFVLSLKNPTAKGPANAQLPQSPDFPQSILDDFNGLNWMPVLKAEYLDYANAQILLIGEGQDAFGSAVEETEKDKKEGNETVEEELEKLEDEDQIRIDALDGDDAVYKDLHISKNDYPDVLTTW